MLIKQISVFVENNPGRMAEITKVIGDAQVNIRALSIADTSDFGILRLIVNDPDTAVEALRGAGLTVALTDVIGVRVSDEPGAFAGAVQVMSDAGINIEYMYAFISHSDNQAHVILRVEEPEKGIQALQDKGYRMISSQEAYSM